MMGSRLKRFLGANVRTAAAFLFALAIVAPARAQISGGTVDQGAGSNLSPWYMQFLAAQHFICDSGCGSPPAVPDSQPFTFGTTSVSIFAAVVDDTATNTVAENSYGAPRMDTNRILYAKFLAAQHIICDSGCSGGTTDTDDGSIASGQTTGLSIGLQHYFTGSAWSRWPASVTASGSITGTACPGVGCVSTTTEGFSVVGVQIEGTYSADLKFEGTADGTNWHDVYWTNTDSSNIAGLTDLTGLFYAPVAGSTWIRVRAEAFNSGTATITYVKSPLPSTVWIANGVIPTSTSITNLVSVDVSDDPTRLVGVTYGSQGQQLQQTAIGSNLKTELFTGATAYDARQIRALTFAGDKVDASGSSVTVSDGSGPVTVDGSVNANLSTIAGLPTKTGWGPGGVRVQLSTDSKVALLGPFASGQVPDSADGVITRNAVTAKSSPTQQLTVVCADASTDACPLGSTVEISPAGYGSVAVLIQNVDTAGTFKMDYTVGSNNVWFSSILYILASRGTAPTPSGGKDTQTVTVAGTTTLLIQAIQTGAMSKVRVRLAARSAGTTATATLTANTLTDPFGLALSAQQAGMATNLAIPSVLGLSDGTTNCTISGTVIFPCVTNGQSRTNNPATNDAGMVVRMPTKRTYAAALTVKTATAAGTGPFLAICGSATTTVRVQRVRIDFTVASAAVYADPRLQKTSTAVSAGTATALTMTPFDSASAAATATNVNFYTVLATSGTVVGTIDIQQRAASLTGTVAQNIAADAYEFRATDEMEAVVLRGTAQCLQGSFGTTTTNAPTMTVALVWTEE